MSEELVIDLFVMKLEDHIRMERKRVASISAAILWRHFCYVFKHRLDFIASEATGLKN